MVNFQEELDSVRLDLVPVDRVRFVKAMSTISGGQTGVQLPTFRVAALAGLEGQGEFFEGSVCGFNELGRILDFVYQSSAIH